MRLLMLLFSYPDFVDKIWQPSDHSACNKEKFSSRLTKKREKIKSSDNLGKFLQMFQDPPNQNRLIRHIHLHVLDIFFLVFGRNTHISDTTPQLPNITL